MATLCSRSRHARAPLAASHITEHSQDQKCLIFPEGGKPDGLENPCGTVENQRTTQLTYGPERVSTRVTLVRGERFMHKLTMPPIHNPYRELKMVASFSDDFTKFKVNCMLVIVMYKQRRRAYLSWFLLFKLLLSPLLWSR